MLEGGVAMFLLVFIVWWTMYSGPKPHNDDQTTLPPPEQKPGPDKLER